MNTTQYPRIEWVILKQNITKSWKELDPHAFLCNKIIASGDGILLGQSLPGEVVSNFMVGGRIGGEYISHVMRRIDVITIIGEKVEFIPTNGPLAFNREERLRIMTGKPLGWEDMDFSEQVKAQNDATREKLWEPTEADTRLEEDDLWVSGYLAAIKAGEPSYAGVANKLVRDFQQWKERK